MGQPLFLLPWLILILQLLLLLSFFCYAYDIHPCSSEEKLALDQFKQSLRIDKEASSSNCDDFGTPSYPKTKDWNMSSDCCSNWNGVACDGSTGNVVELDLSCSQLVGVIGANSSLFQLTHLRRLNLADNNFEGSNITREIGRLGTSLTHLNLSNSGFSGPLPLEISKLSKLVSLDLSNSFDLIPNDSDSKFQFLEFFLQNLTHLRELSLASLRIDSVLPRNLSSFSSLTFLDLYNTGIHGILPNEIFFLPNLRTLHLGFNAFVIGVLPPSNGSTMNHFHSALRELDLSGTMLPETPHTVGSLTSLEFLRLYSCNMIGFIPEFILNLTRLRRLDLSGNFLMSFFSSNFTGLQKLTHLDLSSNSLAASLPSNVTGLQKLTHLDLSYNSLNGTIPSWIYELSFLKFINLGFNILEGQLDEFQFKSNSLEFIHLGVNHLSGFIPQSIFEQVHLLRLDISSNHLSGVLEFEMLASLKKLEVLSLSRNNISVKSSTANISITNSTFPSLKRLDLSFLNMKELPYVVIAMENLEYLDLSNSQIHGRIPEWAPSKPRNLLTHLNLEYNFIEGSIPLWICNSTNLEFLSMSRNNFDGTLQNCLGNLGALLNLDLSWNHLHGIIPSNFGNMSKLLYLILHGNQLQGPVPSFENCKELQIIDLGNNKIKDKFPRWPETLANLQVLILRSNEFHGPIISLSNISNTKLLVMDLSNNRFKGEIPDAFGRFQLLEYLNLHTNDFNGSIPSSFAEGNPLQSLNLHNNHLQGGVPRSLLHCTDLQVLDLGNNQLNDTFPSWLETLPELQVLVLSFNRFHGPITTNSNVKNPFSKLRIIDLSCNEFSGHLLESFFKNLFAMITIDEKNKKAEYLGTNGYYLSTVALVMKGVSVQLERILTILTTIDLSNNQFSGEIPNAIGNLKFLRLLNLSHNSLTGRIPSRLGKLSLLESLDLQSNKLGGEIPKELANLKYLGTLNLSYNHLRGRIPSGEQLSTFGNNSYYGNSALCGFPLPGCEEGEVRPLTPVSDEEGETYFIDGFTWKAVLMGYGCGFVLGLVIGCIMFYFGKPKWFTGLAKRKHYGKIRVLAGLFERKKITRPGGRGYKRNGRRNYVS